MKTKGVYLFLSVLTVAIVLFAFASNLYAAHDYDVYIAQGIQKINEEKYNEALELLKKALELSPDDPEASYYAAIAYSRLNDLDRAEELLLGIGDSAEYASNVSFELGRLYYAKGDCRNAEKYLTNYMSYTKDDDSRNYAGNLISTCYGDTEEKKKYKLNLTVGTQYDDNVVLEANNPSVTSDRKSDGRAMALITAGARLYDNQTVALKVDYNLYQSAHFQLNNFNVHYHKISPTIELNVSNIIKPSAGYSFEYIYFGGDDYGRINTFFAKTKIRETKVFSTDVIYEYKGIHYWDTEEFASNTDRTGHQNTVGIKQNFIINNFKGDIHYFYDDKRAEEDHWSYTGDRIGVACNYKISTPLKIKASIDYNGRDYREDFPGFGETRRDRMQKYAVSLQYSINKKLAVALTESYSINDSNLADYDYKRNVIGVLFTYGVI